MHALSPSLNRRRACVGLLGVAAAAAGCAQGPVASAPLLTVSLADGSRRSFGLAELQALPTTTATVRKRDGSSGAVRGASVTDLLRLAGLDLAQNLGVLTVVGSALVARSSDGYRAVFGLAVADPRYGHPPLLVAWTGEDGGPLGPQAGPLQLVFAGEARAARWVRKLVALEVRAL